MCVQIKEAFILVLSCVVEIYVMKKMKVELVERMRLEERDKRNGIAREEEIITKN